MHEVGIMMETLKLAGEQARASGASRIHVLRMRLGRLSGVVPDSLSYAFEVLNQGTLAEGGRLEIEEVNPTCWCGTCQEEFPTPDLVYDCPRCGQPSGQLRRGTELELVSLEIE